MKKNNEQIAYGLMLHKATMLVSTEQLHQVQKRLSELTQAPQTQTITLNKSPIDFENAQ